MVIDKYDSCIILDIVNLKKTLFNFYKKNSLSSAFEFYHFFKYNRKNYLIIHFNEFNYFHIKKKIFYFLRDEDVYYEILCVKYKNNLYSVSFFESVFFNNDFYNNFLFFVYIYILNKICFFRFFFVFFVLLNNFNYMLLLKCLLYTKQHQK